ncbi:putative secreted Zn-dependent protease [Breoghania corrubedonensis]|uniref:Putative secreted Zn-dependent protease n=1 Tax=Breoghania corrubedonensis TaxID=665038 RepID=A0A2T5V8J2_9HYPH|nr:DUF922 domain-containing protein [Breoghania corrubedonensis]PTW60076.1 putative secreted Zn-dependent protease [Breoghania corrubedonensis]
MRKAATSILTMAAILCFAMPLSAAKAEVISKTRYKRHTVYGSTPASLVMSMNRFPIRQPGKEVVMGLLEMEPSFSYVPVRNANGCRVGALKTRIEFTITLPHARAQSRLDPATRRLWTRFVATVKHHELTHRRYFLDYAARYEARAKRVAAPTCAGVDKALARIAEEEYAKAQRQNDQLDRHDGAEVDNLPLFVAARRGPEIAGNDPRRLAQTRP